MKKIVLIAAVLMSASVHAQVTTAWVNSPGGASIATDASDNIYTTYGEQAPGGDIFLTKRNSTGNIIWTVSPNNNIDNTKYEIATWVATDSVGNIIVTGNLMSGFSNPVNANSIVMKFNPSGALLWRKVYEGSFDGSYTKKSLVDASNNIYVLGLGTGPAGQVTTVKKFAPDGAALWSYFDAAGIGAPVNFKFTPDNNIVISGRSVTGSINGYAKINLNGNNLWNYFANSSTVGDAAGDVSGNTYLVHGDYVAVSTGSIVKKLSPAGNLIWEKTNAMSGFRVEVGGDHHPVISGFPRPGVAGAAFMKYDSNGNMLWANLDADGPSLALLSHAQMKLDASNNAYLAGSAFFNGLNVCKVNSDGTSAWTSSAPGQGAAVGFAFGSNNSVHVVSDNISTAKFVQGPTGVPTTADLSLNLTATPSGMTVNYTVQVTNNGPAAATGVMVGGTLPTCAIGSLASGATASCTSSVTATAAGTLTQTMTVSGVEPDPNTSNNTMSVVTVITVATGANLSLTMTDAPDPVKKGARLVYTLTILNNGPSTASNVSLIDQLPASTTLISATSTKGACGSTAPVSCPIGALNAGATAVVTVTVRPQVIGTIINNASVTTSTNDPNIVNNSATATTTVKR